MSRAVILYCTGRGEHERLDVHTVELPDGVEAGEFVRWTPVFPGSVLTLRCGARFMVRGVEAKCPKVWRLNHKSGGVLLGRLERMSRTTGRVEADLSYLPE